MTTHYTLAEMEELYAAAEQAYEFREGVMKDAADVIRDLKKADEEQDAQDALEAQNDPNGGYLVDAEDALGVLELALAERWAGLQEEERRFEALMDAVTGEISEVEHESGTMRGLCEQKAVIVTHTKAFCAASTACSRQRAKITAINDALFDAAAEAHGQSQRRLDRIEGAEAELERDREDQASERTDIDDLMGALLTARAAAKG